MFFLLMKRWRAGFRLWLLLLLLLPGAARTVKGQVQRATDGDMQPVSGAWRVHAGDDPRFAQPGFDDALWTTLLPQERLRPKLLLPGSDGYLWARLRVRAVRPIERPALLLFTAGSLPYVVFVNGRQVAESAEMEHRMLKRVPPMAVPLPAGDEWTVALRFYYPRLLPPRVLPLRRAELEPYAEARLVAELATLREFDDLHLAEVIGVGLCFGLCVFAVVLYALQRTQTEYLWLALFCGFYGVCVTFKVKLESGALPESTAWVLVYRYLGCAAMVCSLEFVMRFAGSRRRPSARALQALFLLLPLVGPSSELGFVISLVFSMLALFVFMTVYLWSAHRRGMTEVRMLVPFLSLLVLVNAFYLASALYPAHVRFPRRIRFGTLGVGLEDLTILLFLGGVLALVLYRFQRITREEQRNVAELEAARTVQQVWIPEHLPVVPGFKFGSVYQPARQVGGDFLQVLPIAEDGGALFALGDVSGKGLEAAMTVAVIVGALRTLAERTQAPGELMDSLNRRLLEYGVGFTTCVIVRLRADGQGEMCNAGHVPPYVDGRVLEAEPGLPLGLAANEQYSLVFFKLEPGQRLTLVTDGVVEAKKAHGRELFGFERTLAVSTQPAQEIAQAVRHFAAGAEQADDITVFTVSLERPLAAQSISPLASSR